MRIFMIIPVFVTLIDRLCQSETKTKIDEFGGFTELEDAAIHMLTTCYGDRGKTIGLFGDFPDSFIAKLSSHASFAIVSLENPGKPTSHSPHYFQKLYGNKFHKVPIFVTIASTRKQAIEMVSRIHSSIYHNPMASVLILSSYTTKIYEIMILLFLTAANMPNVNLITRVSANRIMILTSVVYSCKPAPQPWQLINGPRRKFLPNLRFYVRVYREHKDTCKNLDFDKTTDSCGWMIQVLSLSRDMRRGDQPIYSTEFFHNRSPSDKVYREFEFIEKFHKYMNATLIIKQIPGFVSETTTNIVNQHRGIVASYRPWRMNDGHSCTYPEKKGCLSLITQFRGNKTQLEKIYDVIDGYSWIGMLIVYLITLCFIKWFLRQPVIVSLLNLVRLTCNCGLPIVPSNLAPRIYIACLLFFVVTMQGIFMGDLASLLTHDIPVRQVNSIQDVIDLGYSVRVGREYMLYFEDPLLKGRVYEDREIIDCIRYIRHDPLMACVVGDDSLKTFALESKQYLSTSCIALEYICIPIELRWIYEKRFNTFLRRISSAGTRMPFNAMVYHERMLQFASLEVVLEPRVMVFEDLRFAFNILAVGLLFASITFVAELIVDCYHRAKTTTRVIMLN